ncbi:MAG: triple tyrosine motif-containing protein [Chlorobium sp.]|nr:triple tyrosine motif-containing protein [Chlorobium sp.]
MVRGGTGITKFDPETGIYKRYIYDPDNPNGISSNWVTAICEDNDGKLWVGTYDNGISIFNPSDESFEHIKADPDNKFGLRSNKIRFLLKTKSGDIWISNQNQGLQLYDQENKHFKFFDVDSSTSNDEATSILLEDSEGTLWIGTMNNGLYGVTFENKKIKKIKHYVHNPKDRNSLSNNFVLDIIQSKVPGKNTLWIATNVGLNKLDLKMDTFTHYFKKDGLPHDFVLKILEDNEGNIWAATANKLCVYNVKTGKFNSYGEDDGMPFTGFGGARQNTAVTLDGQLIFGSGKGGLGLYPEEIINDPIYPQIRLTDFKIFHKSAKLDTAINFKKIINLNHDQNIFSFEFTDLHFSNSRRNQFAYKLEGLYDDWIHIGYERVISFTDLDSGKYIFRVKGVTNDGVWNETGASIVLIIAPPWWATWWFRIIMFLTIIGIGYSIYRYRVNKLLEMERLRIQIASDLHDDIGSALTRIAVHSEIIQTTTEKEKVFTSSNKIGTMSREIITTLSDVVWSIDSRNDTVGDLIDRMRDFLETVFPAGSIHIDFQTKGLHFDQKVDQSLRQNIYLIFKEAVNNAAKHSDADKIQISMINGDGKFKMEIADNGMGINEEKQKGHHGIENMELRAKRINGALIIRKLEKGTSITLIAKNI